MGPAMATGRRSRLTYASSADDRSRAPTCLLDTRASTRASNHTNAASASKYSAVAITCRPTKGHIQVSEGLLVGCAPTTERVRNQLLTSSFLPPPNSQFSGEKPYQCNVCNYSACRRDMITRHMRTHLNHKDSRSRKEKSRGRKRRQTEVSNDSTTADSQMDPELPDLDAELI